MGSSPGNVNFRFNNRPLSDAAYGSYNPELIQPEFMERAEILIGSDAVIFSNNASGALINIQEIRYNTGRPFTRLWYSQAGYNFIGADAIYSQNIMKNWNMTLGFRHLSSDNKYINTSFDMWNVRGILRWNPSDRTSISLTENFTNHGTNLNGGIDYDNTPTDAITGETLIGSGVDAVPYFRRFNERNYRHDLTLSLSSYLADDSSSAFSASAYFTNSEWDRNRSDELFIDENDSLENYQFLDIRSGITGKFEQKLTKFFTLRAGGDISYINVPQTVYTEEFDGALLAGFVHGQINELLPGMILSGGIRINYVGDNVTNAFGASVKYTLSDKFKLVADLSRSERLPSLAENITLTRESHLLGLFDLIWENESSEIRFGLYGRMIDSPIFQNPIINDDGKIITTVSFNRSSRKVYGTNLLIKSKLIENLNLLSVTDNGHLFVHLFAQTNLNYDDGVLNYRYPRLYSGIKIYYQAIAGQSIMNIGFNFSVLSEFNGEYFVQQNRNYVPYDRKSVFSNNGLDAFAELRLGDAFLRVMFKNILAQTYYYVPVYPQHDRTFRLSVSWAFFD